MCVGGYCNLLASQQRLQMRGHIQFEIITANCIKPYIRPIMDTRAMRYLHAVFSSAGGVWLFEVNFLAFYIKR